MICECGMKTGNHDGAVISKCSGHVQAMLLPPDWLARIRLPPSRTRETNDQWAHKLAIHRRQVVDVIRAYDKQRKKEVA